MKFTITTQKDKYKKHVKILEKIFKEDEFRMFGNIVSEIATKLTTWEMLIGEEMTREVVKTYLKGGRQK